MSGPDIAGLAVSVFVVAGRVSVSLIEFGNRMKLRSTWLESHIKLCESWTHTMEYIAKKVRVNEHLVDHDGLILIGSQLRIVKSFLETVDYDLKALIEMSDRYLWNRMYAQWKLDGKRANLDSALTVINTSVNNVNALLGIATNPEFREIQQGPQEEEPFPKTSQPSSQALSSPRPSVVSTMTTASTIDDSTQSQIKVACKGLEFKIVEWLLDNDDTGELHLTTDRNKRTLLDIAIKHNSSVDHRLVETVQTLLEKQVEFTLCRHEHQNTFRTVKAEIKARKMRKG